MNFAFYPVEFAHNPGAHISDAAPELKALFGLCACWLQLKLPGYQLVVTSVKRDDPASTHYYGRAIDFGFVGEVMQKPAVIRVLLALKRKINLDFPYIKSDGSEGATLVYRDATASNGSDPNHTRHVHIQLPHGGWSYA